MLSCFLSSLRPSVWRQRLTFVFPNRDLKSNYLEGALCVLVYIIIAVTTWYYPNPAKGTTNVAEGGGSPVGAKF